MNNLNPDLIKNLFSFTTFEVIIKWLAVGGLVVYSIFALVIIKQVGIMSETFDADANVILKLFAWAHFLMAVFLVLAVAVIW